MASAWAAQTNSYYAFSRDTPLYARGEESYEPLATLPEAGGTYYFQRTVYSATLPSADAAASAAVEQQWVPYVVTLDADQIAARFVMRDGQCVALAGTPRYVRPVELGTLEKDPNATGSAPYVERLGVTDVEGGGVRLASRLGNNGVLVLPAGTEEPPVVDPDPEPTPDPDPTPDPEPEPDPEPNPDPEPKPDPEPEPDPEPKPDPEPEPDSEPEPDPDAAPDQTPEERPSDDQQSSDRAPDKLPSTGDASTSAVVLLGMLLTGTVVAAVALAIRRRA